MQPQWLDDTLMHVFSYLPYCDLSSVLCTCRHFYHLALPLRYTVVHIGSFNQRHVLSLPRFSQILKQSSLCNAIRHLFYTQPLDEASPYPFPVILASHVTNLSGIRSLRLCVSADALTQFPWREICQHWTRLCELNVMIHAQPGSLVQPVPSMFTENVTRLSSLWLHATALTADQWYQLGDALSPTLASLNVIDCTTSSILVEAFYHGLAIRSRKLRNFKHRSRGPFLLKDNPMTCCLTELVKQCVELEEMVVSECDELTVEFWQALPFASHLRVLHLAGRAWTAAPTLPWLLEAVGQSTELKDLILHEAWPNVFGPAFVCDVLRRGRALTRLRLVGLSEYDTSFEDVEHWVKEHAWTGERWWRQGSVLFSRAFFEWNLVDS